MASAENQALEQATAALTAELQDVSSVDGEVAAVLQQLPALLAQINPVSPAQVNAVTTATETIKDLTAKLKGEAVTAAGEEAAAQPPAAQPPAEGAGTPAPAPGGEPAQAAGGEPATGGTPAQG